MAAGLSDALLARLAGGDLSTDDVRAAEKGRTRLTAAQLDRLATVFGVRLDDLLDGHAGRSPLSLLLRSSLEGQDPSVQELVATECHLGLGEFLRVVRDIADVESLLGRKAKPLPSLSLEASWSKKHLGEARAQSLRKHLGLGLEPVRSMRQVVERDLEIRVVWVSEDHLDRSVDGACTLDPRPALLVNLIEPEQYPWRMRITLAHELCHLLFDTEPGRRAMVSPDGKGAAMLRIRSARSPRGQRRIDCLGPIGPSLLQAGHCQRAS